MLKYKNGIKVDKMKFLVKSITAISIFISFLYSANVGDSIVNSANIEYVIDGIDKNQTTNEVTNSIEQTDAIIEFLKFDKKAKSYTLRPTKYKDSNGNFKNMPDAKLKDGTTIKTPADIKLSNTSTYSNDDLVVIRVTDFDQNKDSTKIDTVTITVINPNTGDKEELILQESGPNTGVFIGYTQAVTTNLKKGDGYITVLPDDKIIATYNDNGNNKTIDTKAKILVDSTNAKIEFLAFDEKAKSKEFLQSTKCKGKDGKWHQISKAKLHNQEEYINTPANLALKDTTKYYNRDLIVIKVTDNDQNIHSSQIDYIEITVVDPSTKDSVTLQLQESDVNSGVFIGFTQSVTTKTDKNDCKLSVNPKDKIYAKYNDKSQNKIISDIATIEVEKTKAEIHFLKYSENNRTKDSNGTVILKPTMCYANGKWHKIGDAKLPNGEAVTPPKEIAILDAKEYHTQDFVVIRVDDFDQNIHDDQIDTIKVSVIDPKSGDRVELQLFETELDSGVFVGYTHTTPNRTNLNDCEISVKAGDLIYATYFDESHGKKRVDSAKIKEMPFSIMVTKNSSKNEASIGEFIKYTISIKNLRKLTLKNIKIYDKLPDGLKFIEKSFKVDGKKVDLNISKDGKKITFNIKILGIGASKELSYVATITSNAKDEAINQAWADGRFGIKSNLAKNRLKIKKELYKTKGFIVGKVYNKAVDCNKTKESNDTKVCGVKGVKLYLEDGRYTITDENGRYHFVDVESGTHVVQIDELTIKDRYKVALCSNNTRFANRGNSQFVDILNGELKRADFCLKPLAKSNFKSLLNIKLKKLDKNHLELKMQIDSTKKLLDPEVYIALPDGVSFINGSTSSGEEAVVQKGILIVPMDKSSKSVKLEINLKYPIDDAIEAMLYYDTKISQDLHTQKITLPIVNESNSIKLAKKEATTTIIKHETKNAKGDFGWSKAIRKQIMPSWTPQELDKYGKKPQIIWPPKGWVPFIPSTKIVVLYSKDEHIELSLNGKKVSALNYQKLFKNSDGSMKAIYYKGVDLAEGKNRITAIVKNRANKLVKSLTRDIWVESHLPERVEYLKEFSYLKADGKHTPIIAVKFLAKSGHPLRGGLVGSYEIKGDYEPYKKQNGKGVFEIDSNGIAYIRLKPTTKAGVALLKFKLINQQEQTIRVKLKPHFRDWIVVGFAEGSVGYEILNKNSEPISSKISTKAHVALFAKGKIKGKYLLTLAYNSKKRDRELFDQIDPNKYYLLYGDNSEQKNEASTTKKIYIKLESESFYALFGDIKTEFNGSEYLNYDRSFTGFKTLYDKNNFRVNAFIAKTKKVHIKEELRGDGTNGYYYLKSKNIVDNSEKITIETRDRIHKDKIISSKTLSRYSDYDIDYTNSRIFFKEPIYSVDKKRNPIYIVVEYDIDGDNSNNYTWGVDASYKTNKLELNTRVVNEDILSTSSSIFGGSLKYNFNKKSSFYLEIAHSINKLEDKTISANARYAELKYSDKNLTLKAWYRYKDGNYGLENSIVESSGNRDIGLRVTKKVTNNVDIEAEISNQKEFTSKSSSTTEATTKVNYKDKNTTASIGFRHIKSNRSANQVIASISQKMLDNNLTISLSHEQNLGKEASSTYPTLTTLEADYKIDKNTTIFGSISRTNSDNESSYESLVGFSYKPWKDGEIKFSRNLDKSGDINRVYNVLTLRQKYQLNKQFTFNFGYEKGIYEGENSSSYDALNTLIEYNNKKHQGKLLIGGRVSANNKKLNIDFAYKIDKSKNQALAFGAKSYINWDKNNTTRTSDASLSYVYRPQNSKVVVLDKLEFKEEYKKENNEKEQTLKFINNIHINWRAKDKLELGVQYGLKYIIDNIDNEEYDSWIDFLALFAQYDYKEDLTFGAQLSMLHAYSGNNFNYGFGVYATKTVWDNAEITLGYNLKGFKDSDFNLQNNFNSKVYLKFRIKFDQSDFKSLLDEVK